MHLEQRRWCDTDGWTLVGNGLEGGADVVFVFGSTARMESEDRFADVRSTYPDATLVGCSTGGEIQNARVLEDTVVTAAVSFETAETEVADVVLDGDPDSHAAGRELAESLRAPALTHVVLLSDGVHVNGSALIDGVTQHLPDQVTVTGGLAADGPRFERTPLWCNALLDVPSVVGIGFYGDQLQVGHGSLGGWDPFGPRRRIQRAEGNVLYELDDHSALALYKRYLGPYAEDLPASGLRFPLAVQLPGKSHEIVRTVIGVSEEDQSITFAGDVPEGAYARFMKANNERLIDGAVGAAESSRERLTDTPVEFALLISCIGRKQVLQQRIEEEVEYAGGELGSDAGLIGFYSYGEISPAHTTTQCELHNQTMTITTFAEL